MGREIRQVPPNWEHPRCTEEDNKGYPKRVGEYRPCLDKDFVTASMEWKEAMAQWYSDDSPTRTDFWKDSEYWEYDYPPDRETCRPAFTEEPIWYQLYETVSEGTPVSPPFATIEEIASYLVENGDFWYQGAIAKSRPPSRTKPTYEQALAMCEVGHAFSLAIVNGQLLEPHEQNEVLKP